MKEMINLERRRHKYSDQVSEVIREKLLEDNPYENRNQSSQRTEGHSGHEHTQAVPRQKRRAL